MNEPDFQLKSILPWMVTLLMGVVAWFSRRNFSRYDEGLNRIAILERHSVTYDHLERVLDKMRSEARQERQTMHDENKNLQKESQSMLQRIERKIDSNEQRSSKSTMKLSEELQNLALKFAEATGRNIRFRRDD